MSVVSHTVVSALEARRDACGSFTYTATAEVTGRNVGRAIVVSVSVDELGIGGFDSTHSFEREPDEYVPSDDR